MNFAAIKLSSVQHGHISLGLSKFKQQWLLITPGYTCHSNHFC